jgi:tetratricopeptide (TPR) repeat protein
VVAIGAPLAVFRLQKAYQIEVTSRKRAESREKLTKAEALCLQLKFEEAHKLTSEVQFPLDPRDARDGAVLFCNLADYFARRGRWKEAATDVAKVLELEPDRPVDWISLATLLLVDGDTAGYRNHCEAMLARFGATKEPNYAQRISKVCLLLPVRGEDLTKSASLADLALSSGPNTWRDYTKGLAEYRQGRFTNAVNWTEKVLAKPASATRTAYDVLYAQDAMVLAMAHYHLGQTNEARAVLAKGNEIIETKLPKLEGGDLGIYWVDWIITQVLMSEAKALIEGGAASGNGPK